jgi:predicted lactoylglutathione lyase
MSGNNVNQTKFENSIPILRVADLQASVSYYVETLGFKQADWGNAFFTAVFRDRAAIYLCKEGQGCPGTWVWVGVEDVTQLHEEYQASGALILRKPANYPWAYEMHVQDPDGHVLRFGSEPKMDQPLAEADF